MIPVLDLVVLLGVIVGGVGLTAWGWNRFAGHTDEQNFRHQLRDLQQQPNPTPEQQAAQRDAAYRWADDQLDQARRQRPTAPENQEGSHD
jgi:hypothetical protein